MTYEEILSHFQVKKYGNGKAQALCPAHPDKEASLTITQGNDGRTLLKCHAGCSSESVVLAAGLKMADLFNENRSEEERWRIYIESREKRKIEAVYNYVSINGEYAYTKIRLEGKKMLFGMLKDGRFEYGLKGRNKKEFNAIFGSVPKIKEAIERNEPIFIPEGEKDVNTLVKKGYTAFSCGGANDWNKNVSELCNGAEVIILADNDAPGEKLAATIEKDLKGISKSVKIIVPMPDVPKADITDYFEVGHTVQEFECLIRQENRQLKLDVSQENAVSTIRMFDYLECDYDKDGNVKSVKQLVHNFEVVMDKDYRIAGKIRFDEFAQQICLFGSVPWENENNCRVWSSHDDSALFSLIQADYGLKSRQDFADALKNVSMRNKFHPVRELLDSLTWDGKEHIRGLLPEYLGAEDSDYTYQVMRLWMLGAVSRVYKPGSKFDYTMILQGSQGIGKSTFLKQMALDDSWFNDSLDSLDSDKAVQSLTGSWIIELAELKSLARTAGGVESVKRFLTATQDKYRIPYERRADTFYRQCVFAGTTNKDDFLQDETGNRRFLIVQTGVKKPSKSLFVPEIMDTIKQAWAEAVHIWKNEKPQLILPEACMREAKELQEANMADDGKRGIILEYLEGKTEVCARQIWFEALKETIPPRNWQTSEINNIVAKVPGWEKIKTPRKFEGYGQQRGFRKITIQTTEEKAESSEFVVVSEQEQMELPFD